MKQPPRLDYIDGLRGLAICGVVLVHSGQLIEGLPGWLRSLSAYGGHGVGLFFTLSALTLASVYRRGATDWRGFFIRRWFRVAPMFYLGALAYLALRGTGASLYAPDGIGARQIILTFLFLHGWNFDSINSVVPGGWSIANEAMFYLLFPLLTWHITSGRRAVLALAAAVILSRLSYKLIPLLFVGMAPPPLLEIFAAFCFPTQCFAFLGGFCVYYLVQRLETLPAERLRKPALGVFWLMAALLIALAASNNKSLGNYLLADLLFIPFIAAAAHARTPVVLGAAMRRLGQLSYSIYIVHFAFADLFKAVILPHLSRLDPVLQLAAAYACILAAATALSAATHRWIEIPMIEIGRGLAQRRLTPPARAG